ncbi:MAG: hypothetical protein LBQ15_06230 [Clostridium sp.]|jgi:hypothetical protein|nr:hypothetical protein [Clostridium sp.]
MATVGKETGVKRGVTLWESLQMLKDEDRDLSDDADNGEPESFLEIWEKFRTDEQKSAVARCEDGGKTDLYQVRY